MNEHNEKNENKKNENEKNENETAGSEPTAGETTDGETPVLTPAQLLEKKKLIAMGDRMKKIRNELRLNQSEVADACSVSKSYMSKFESGEGNPSPYFFIKLAELFNINLDFLFIGYGRMFNPVTPQLKGPDNLLDDVSTIDDIVWLMENSKMARSVIFGYVSRYFYENEHLIRRNIKKDRERKTLLEEKHAAALAGKGK